jgi:hypothetical protein
MCIHEFGYSTLLARLMTPDGASLIHALYSAIAVVAVNHGQANERALPTFNITIILLKSATIAAVSFGILFSKILGGCSAVEDSHMTSIVALEDKIRTPAFLVSETSAGLEEVDCGTFPACAGWLR